MSPAPIPPGTPSPPHPPDPPHSAADLRLPDPLPVPPLTRPFDASVVPPGSKSLTNRLLLLASLARGTSVLRHALTDADDAQRMLAAIRALGAKVRHAARTPPASAPAASPASAHDDSLEITGVAGSWRLPPEGVTLDLGNAGTATRFLAAAAILNAPASGPIVIDGNARMRERPIGELADAIAALGARVQFLGVPGFPPLRVLPAPTPHPDAARSAPPHPVPDLRASAHAAGGGPALLEFDTTQSSQFISAVLLVAPFLPNGLRVRFRGEVTSVSYVRMTLALLRAMGVAPTGEPPGEVFVPHAPVEAFNLDVEPDASGATYFWAAAALHPGSRLRTPGLGSASIQEDARFVELLATMGARVTRTAHETLVEGAAPLRPIHADLSLMPDAALTLAALCCFADGPSELLGLRTLRVKETDRVEALRTELTRAGAHVAVLRRTRASGPDDEGLRIEPIPLAHRRAAPPGRLVFQTYDDHRMAMSLALVASRLPGCSIADPGCVRKTYPRFWSDFDRLRV